MRDSSQTKPSSGPLLNGHLLNGALCVLCVMILLMGQASGDEQAPPVAIVIPIEGGISPVTAEWVSHGFEQAHQRQARLIVLKMDTPGGLDQAMRSIVQQILTSDIPVVTYVSPGGARAASAGAYILYASHVAAMAPGTNLGAATPVQIGGGLPGQPDPKSDPAQGPDTGKTSENPTDAESKSAMSRKMVNDAAAYIRSLAQLRERNLEWAEKFVRDAASLSAEEALQANVIDLIAMDQTTLLNELDGITVQVKDREMVLQTKGVVLQTIEPDWRIELLSVIADPNVAYILILLGIYGLMFEFYNPGFVLPSVIGAISLILAMYALQVLPINYAGLALLILGICFMIAEAFAPSFGILGMGGVVAFVVGSIILIDTEAENYGISMPLIAAVTLTSALFFIGLLGVAFKARSRPVVSGVQNLIGESGMANEDFERRGLIHLHGELWTAESPVPLKKGQKVRVVGMDGLTLSIKPEET